MLLQVTDHELLTSSIDGRVRRYDLRVGSLFTDYIGSPVTCAKFSKDGQCFLTSSHDSTLRLLDISTGEMLGEDKNVRLIYTSSITLVCFVEFQRN